VGGLSSSSESNISTNCAKERRWRYQLQEEKDDTDEMDVVLMLNSEPKYTCK
jgi:hypothetical protein